jgi:hypothetical protein
MQKKETIVTKTIPRRAANKQQSGKQKQRGTTTTTIVERPQRNNNNNNNNNNKQLVRMPSRHPALPKFAPTSSIGAMLFNEKALTDAYVACLFNPSLFQSKVPDANPRKTTLICSTQEFSLNAFFDTSTDSGRFSIVTKPVLGTIDTPLGYKTAILLGDRPWGEYDFSSSDSYVNYTNGQDPRIDTFTPTLTQPNAFYFQMNGNTGMVANIPLGTNPTYSQNNYGFDVFYDVATGNLSLPLGSFLVTLEYKGTGIVAPTVDQTSGSANLQPLDTGSDATLQTNTWAFQVTTAGLFNLNAAGSTTITSSFLSISPAYFSQLPITLNGGMVKQIRPVAQNILFTASIPPIVAGGNISAAYVPAGTCETNYFTNNGQTGASIGQLQKWDQLGTVVGAYKGKYERGAYTWWSPETMLNSNFQTPGPLNGIGLPCMIVSGQVQTNTTTLTGSQPVGRVIISTVYEVICNSTLFEANVSMGSQAVVDAAKCLVASQEHSMGNADHMPWLKKTLGTMWKFAKTAGQFAYENRDAIGALVKAGVAVV